MARVELVLELVIAKAIKDHNQHRPIGLGDGGVGLELHISHLGFSSRRRGLLLIGLSVSTAGGTLTHYSALKWARQQCDDLGPVTRLETAVGGSAEHAGAELQC